MEGFKTFVRSRTIAGAVIAILPQVAALAGLGISPEDATNLWAHTEELVTIGGSLFAIYGRVAATKRISRP